MLCTISGQYDLMAKVTEETTQTLDMVIDKIAALEGVKQTLSHIVLSQKKIVQYEISIKIIRRLW